MDKRRRWTALFLIVLLLGMVPVCMAKEQEESLTELQNRHRTNNELNGLRNELGLRTLSIVPQLNKAAQNHSNYMYRDKQISSMERAGQVGYTGVTLMDRMQYAGYTGYLGMEIDGARISGYAQLLSQSLHDPYQRYALLHPGYDEIGYGLMREYACIVLGSGKLGSWSDTLVMYPYAGQQEVGNCSLLKIGEIPEEIRGASKRYLIGEPITVTYYSPEADCLEFRNVEFTLMDTKQGKEIPVVCVLPQDQFQLGQTLCAYPMELYNTDTRYEVSFTCEVWDGDRKLADVSQNWSYTSSGPDAIGEVSRIEALTALAELYGIEADEAEPQQEFKDYRYDPENPESVLVYRLLKEGILRFRTDGDTLKPQDGITREQMAIWMMQMMRKYQGALYYSVSPNYENTFEDINKCSTQGKIAVQRAYQFGLVQDQGGGKFSPDVYITRSELEAWLTALRELLAELETAEE